ncbi:hypothetical protein BI364_15845 [Acidihalobacter yilgarnensis]|uniref:Uncharacterized protein n=1 Tax=Acidihalobacter yilgarnensis TaxID=2819280 RepID=A0A1D8IRS5_9GAMM|nr:hypothetical protein [Acidihalobacter yilgarnensis]AOU99210.1 hypothetical protein BI364_15845 [Acidihalobacter yilgarnensis]
MPVSFRERGIANASMLVRDYDLIGISYNKINTPAGGIGMNKVRTLIFSGCAAAVLLSTSGIVQAQQMDHAASADRNSAYENSRYMRDFPASLLKVQPPWNKPIYNGTELTVPGLQNVPDIHGDVNDPQLVVFFAGNQYMLVNHLMKDFMKAYPRYKRVVAFTMPPGRLITAIKRGDGILIGNMHVNLKPDILTAGHGSILHLQDKMHWFSKTEVYAKNKLAIMVYKGNPQHVTHKSVD